MFVRGEIFANSSCLHINSRISSNRDTSATLMIAFPWSSINLIKARNWRRAERSWRRRTSRPSSCMFYRPFRAASVWRVDSDDASADLYNCWFFVTIWTCFTAHVNCLGFFWRCLWLFACVWNISVTAERICTKFTGKTCFVPRSEEFGCKGQRSKVKVTRDKERGLRPIFRESLNWFASNSHGRCVWSLAWPRLKVKVKCQRARSPGGKRGFRRISMDALNQFATNSHGRGVWSLARTSLKVKVNFGGLRADCV